MFPVQPLQQNPLNIMGSLAAGSNAVENMRQQAANTAITQAQAKYAEPSELAKLQQAQAIAKYAEPNQIAGLGLTNAQAQAQRAQAGYLGSESGINQQKLSQMVQQAPYLLQKTKAEAFASPIAQTAFDISQAEKDPNLSRILGVPYQGDSQAQVAPQQQDVNPPLAPHQGGMDPRALPAAGEMSSYIPSIINSDHNPDHNMAAINAVGNPAQMGLTREQNLTYFKTPWNPLQLKLLEGQVEAQNKELQTQKTTGVTSWNDALKEAGDEADMSNKALTYLNDLKDGYAKSHYKGGLSGTVNPQGFEPASLMMRADATAKGLNLSNEQNADTASKNLALVRAKQLFGGRVSNMEVQYNAASKPGRNLEPDAFNTQAGVIQATENRTKEYQQYMNAAKNSGLFDGSPNGVDQARAVWQMYNNQRQPFDFQSGKENTDYSGSWKDYLTPDAVKAVQTGQPYVPTQKLSHKQLKYLTKSELKYLQSKVG